MVERILILGGTREAAGLAAKLVDLGHDVTTSLAGRTKEPAPLKGNTRTGGFGGAAGLAKYLTENKINKLIDATHPFAKQISTNAVEAARFAEIPLKIRTRPEWEKQQNDAWIEVKSLKEARDQIPTRARVLLALGHQHIELFKTRADVFFLVRMVDEPTEPLSLPNHHLLIGKPHADWQGEAKILTDNKISHIVCRNSGGKCAYAKIEAARQLAIPVIIVGR